MSPNVVQKPILHGRDHAPGGADPIPGWPTGGGVGGGIAFDTDNEGGWLFVQANDYTEGGGSLYGQSIEFRDRSDGGGISLSTFNGLTLAASNDLYMNADRVRLHSDKVSSDSTDYAFEIRDLTGALQVSLSDIYMQASGAGATLTMARTGDVSLYGGNSLTLDAGFGPLLVGTSPSGSLGFFGTTPVPQPATPVTLADVIGALTALGLVAP